MSEVRYRVTYYEWLFNRYGEKDYIQVDQWVTESTLADLKNDRHVDELEIIEQKEVIV